MAISRECLRRGHSIDVFTMKWDGDSHEDMSIILVPAQGISNHKQVASFVKNLQNFLNRSAYDLVIGFNRIPGLDLYFAADVCYRDRIQYQRNFLSRFTPRYRIFSAFEKTIFSQGSSTEIIYLASQEKKKYQKIYGTPDDRFHYAPPGVDVKSIHSFLSVDNRLKIRNELNLEQDDIFLLMIGSHFRTKGVDRSLFAIASLPLDILKTTFLFVIGKGDPKKYEKLAKKLGIGDHVRFLGGRDDVPQFLAGADLLMQPSIFESGGNAIVEALVAGIPVLATGTCGYAEHVTRAQAGLIIPGDPFEQEKMNIALEHLLTSQKEKWHEHALAYADRTDLSNRKEVVADLIEKVGSSKRCLRHCRP